MAKVLATIAGTALEPGVSRNRRWYTSEHIAGAVAAAQRRIARGDQPMVMLSHHEAGDDSLRIAAALRAVSLTEDGRVRWKADIPDTETGREIAKLADTSDGKPAFLESVSIRGRWTGRVRKVRAPDGELAEQGDGLLIDGLDFTHNPGVPSARIDAFAWAKNGASETTESVLITESVQEARVTITEETAPDAPAVPAEVREALGCLFGEAATVPLSKRDSGLKGGKGTPYADPGYQPDGKQRYELDTPAHIRAAYAFVSQAKNAKAYSTNQLKRIKGRIKAAAGKAGISITAEGWLISPAIELTESLLEYYGGDPSCAGSYSLSATNGPTTVTVCSYGCDPADLMVILAQACKGAGMALSVLDPDMDADIDLPGEQESAEDPDMPAEEASVPAAVTETAPVETPAPEPAAADRETEVPAMSETTTTEAVAPATAAAPASLVIPQDVMDEAIRKAAKKAAKRALQGTAAPAESAPAAPAAEAVTETDEQRIARIVEERIAAARAEAPAAPAVTETEDQRISRIVEERLVAERQNLTASGQGPGRKGLVTEHSAARAGGQDSLPENFPMKDGVMIPMEKWTEEQRRAVGNTWQDHVLGDRAVY